MAARAIWKGVIGLGKLEVPVKLYAAVEDRTVHFRLLHKKDLAPVKQVMVDSQSGEPVESATTKKGAAASTGRFVIITPQDLEAVEPAPSRSIAIERFVPRQALDFGFYDRPYWLGPDSGGAESYAALVDALGDEREGVAHWVMRNRAYTGALLRKGDHLMLITLRQAVEVLTPAEIEVPEGRAADAKEVAMAKQLVEMLKGKFDPDEFRDEHRDRIRELIERKARGEKIRSVRPTSRRATSSLTSALERSIATIARRPASVSREQPARRTRKSKATAHG